MKTIAATVCLITLTASLASGIRTDELVKAVLGQQEDLALSQVFSGLSGRDELLKGPPENQKAYVLIKYIVVPSKAKEFIKVIEESKEAAEKFKGYRTYHLAKPVEDNITYLAWTAWETVEDLIHYFKSEEAAKIIKFTIEQDIVTLVSGIRLLV